ncbi:unnamed protein product [Staurois parvus]|uniref:Secreted protein n=1 Tax=Staurois parvus TaxID=386267 RepID=A0ABN9AB91_9NEOB|nr:unnamed protein product [Staurois parvus]
MTGVRGACALLCTVTPPTTCYPPIAYGGDTAAASRLLHRSASRGQGKVRGNPLPLCLRSLDTGRGRDDAVA